MAIDWILVLNAGSSSLKAAAYGRAGARLAAARLEEVDVAALDSVALFDLAERLHRAAAPRTLAEAPLAVGHRIVHGLDRRAPCRLDAAARAAAEAASAFAPLHNPPALHAADLAARLWPGAAAYACFDTAFHADAPALETTLALPEDWRALGLRRYGFHGLSYASLVRRFEAE
ncbi:MAG: acetate kinase, partial [Pseudomonadota bacterium]